MRAKNSAEKALYGVGNRGSHFNSQLSGKPPAPDHFISKSYPSPPEISADASTTRRRTDLMELLSIWRVVPLSPTAAHAWACASKTGAATHLTPTLFSSSSTAYPASRTRR